MLDMGGAPSGMNDKNANRMNSNKNCQVQAICFDFDVLTRSVDSAEKEAAKKKAHEELEETLNVELGKATPDASVVQEIANVLKVDLPDGTTGNKEASQPEGEEDDLSLLTGESPEKPEKATKEHTQRLRKSKDSPAYSDIRSKYAAKLSKKIEGGMAGVALAKHETETNKGDAAGHMAYRKIAAAEPAARRWMAMTGTGHLLQFLTQRSTKIALLPHPSEEIDLDEGERMEDMKKQLFDVAFDLLVKDGTLGAKMVIAKSLESLNLDPSNVLLVSDRDDYLRAAKDCGMVTCRIRPLNAPRGNISTNHSVPSVPEVKDVVNEINGISFNNVFQSR
jgi:hypothetical protein